MDVPSRVFNYRLSRARRVVENAFGILAARFRILLREMAHEYNTAIDITLACCALHNMLRTWFPTMCVCLVDREDNDHNVMLVSGVH